MSRLVLYYAAGSPPARSVMMLGQLLGVPLERRHVNLLRFEHKTPEFRKINPMGTVPVLQDGKCIISESHAILKYLLASYGGTYAERLYPTNVKTRALVDQCMYFNAGYLFPRAASVVLSTLLYGQVEASPKQLNRIYEAYSVVEAYLQGHRFLAADHFTLADLAVGATATASRVVLDIDRHRYPRCTEWIDELENMACFKSINSEGIAMLTSALNKMLAKNKLKQENVNQN